MLPDDSLFICLIVKLDFVIWNFWFEFYWEKKTFQNDLSFAKIHRCMKNVWRNGIEFDCSIIEVKLGSNFETVPIKYVWWMWIIIDINIWTNLSWRFMIRIANIELVFIAATFFELINSVPVATWNFPTKFEFRISLVFHLKAFNHTTWSIKDQSVRMHFSKQPIICISNKRRIKSRNP